MKANIEPLQQKKIEIDVYQSLLRIDMGTMPLYGEQLPPANPCP